MSKQSVRAAFKALWRSVAPLAFSLLVGLAAFDMAPKDQGIGGTGSIFRGEDQGLTGTGYFGTISNFGSIIINGREIDVSEAPFVKIDGVTADISELKIGHVIAARSSVTNTHESIQTIDVLHAVIGPVDAFDPATGLGRILGQTVDFNSRVDHESIAKEMWIAVSGLRTQNGVIVASRVERTRANEFLVRGDRAQIETALQALHLTAQSPSGSSLVLSGAISSGQPQIHALRHVPLMALLNNTKTLVVETYVPASVAGQDRTTLSLLGERLVLKNEIKTDLPSAQTRRVLEGVNRNGQMLVTRTAPAPFDDRRSGASLKQTFLDNALRKRSTGSPNTSSSESFTEGDPPEPDSDGLSQTPDGGSGSGKTNNGGGNESGDKGGGGRKSGGDKSEKD